MADYFRDLLARHHKTADMVKLVVAHPFTGEAPAIKTYNDYAKSLIGNEEAPGKLLENTVVSKLKS